jgi:hypothetical protein
MSAQGSKHGRLTFGKFVDKVFWAMVIYLAHSISKNASSINENIQTLNEKMASIIATVSNQDRRMDSLDSRLEHIEMVHIGELGQGIGRWPTHQRGDR